MQTPSHKPREVRAVAGSLDSVSMTQAVAHITWRYLAVHGSSMQYLAVASSMWQQYLAVASSTWH